MFQFRPIEQSDSEQLRRMGMQKATTISGDGTSKANGNGWTIATDGSTIKAEYVVKTDKGDELREVWQRRLTGAQLWKEDLLKRCIRVLESTLDEPVHLLLSLIGMVVIWEAPKEGDEPDDDTDDDDDDDDDDDTL